MRFISLILLLCIYASISFGQNKYLLPNEEIIFSFKTKNGRILSLNKDKSDKYIVYRFGTKDNIELEYPEKNKSSWNKFEYSYWLRGGGIDNEGIDLNYVTFTMGNIKYVIYDTYFSRGEEYAVGIKVIDLKTQKEIDISGLRKTRKGTIVDLRYNDLIKRGEEIYD